MNSKGQFKQILEKQKNTIKQTYYSSISISATVVTP